MRAQWVCALLCAHGANGFSLAGENKTVVALFERGDSSDQAQKSIEDAFHIAYGAYESRPLLRSQAREGRWDCFFFFLRRFDHEARFHSHVDASFQR
jgi:hypothetical protein